MLYFNFTRIFKLKNIQRPFTYLTSLGYSKSFATKMTKNNVQQLNLAMVERICRDFNCTPNDILDFRMYENDVLSPDHALHSLTKVAITNEVFTKINTLPAEKIQQIHDIIKNME